MTVADWKLQQMVKASGWPLGPELLKPGTDFCAPAGNGLVPLHWACVHGKDGLVKHMIAQDANVLSMTGAGHSMLALAVQSGSFQTVMLLIDQLKALAAPLPSADLKERLLKTFGNGHPNQKNRLQQTLKDWERIRKLGASGNAA